MGHVNHSGQDPAEGSRETIERELHRSGPDRSKTAGAKPKPGDPGGDPGDGTNMNKGREGKRKS